MKHIQKNKKEPIELTEDKKVFNSFESLSGEAKKAVQEALLDEQGYICAYCMQRISTERNKKLNKPRIEIEHYLPQQTYPNEVLNYQNMLGVCNGNINNTLHCDKTMNGKSDGTIILKKLNPLDKNCEKLIAYQKDGKIISKNNDIDVENDLNQILNLNHTQLCQNRKIALDKYYDDFKKQNNDRTKWNKVLFEKFIEEKLIPKNKKGQFKEFVNFLIAFFEEKKEKGKYNKK
ncbi:MAG: TIGR02646 family protein [Bacteroidetes bacterium]|nr:MAG: TIGR02646 family protein [Bacteroidota bacterium]TAG89350.1 MAG: TIGR02646 family protein [Bacteroidota bacterium]